MSFGRQLSGLTLDNNNYIIKCPPLQKYWHHTLFLFRGKITGLGKEYRPCILYGTHDSSRWVVVSSHLAAEMDWSECKITRRISSLKEGRETRKSRLVLCFGNCLGGSWFPWGVGWQLPSSHRQKERRPRLNLWGPTTLGRFIGGLIFI